MPIKYALIAAGQGSRLVSEGVPMPKPLVQVGGEPLIGRMLRIFQQNDAESISVIINEEMTQVYDYLLSQTLQVPLHIVVKSTPDSFHSFYELKSYLRGGKDQLLHETAEKFCLTTVDPIFNEQEFSNYVKQFAEDDSCNALMAVTDYVDDEKPLYVLTDSEGKRVTGYSNEKCDACRFISGGIYCMDQKVLALLPKAMEEGVERMRGFQAYLVKSGLNVEAWKFGKVIDIDHAQDIVKAEEFLKA